MEGKLFLHLMRHADARTPEHWILLFENNDGTSVTAIPIPNPATLSRLKREGVPIKVHHLS